jgi:hypothetical protein
VLDHRGLDRGKRMEIDGAGRASRGIERARGLEACDDAGGIGDVDADVPDFDPAAMISCRGASSATIARPSTPLAPITRMRRRCDMD